MLVETSLLIDLLILAVIVVGSVAFMGTISNVIGMKIFGGKNVNRYRDKTDQMTSGWKKAGGKQ